MSSNATPVPSVPRTPDEKNELDTSLQVVESDNGGQKKFTTGIYRAEVDVSGVDEKKLIRKIDWVLIPWLSFLYLLSFLDRTSIGNARLYNMVEDLRMTDKQYLTALTIFFFSYSIFEVPSNVVLKRLRPSVWLSTLMLLWGTIMLAQGLVTNYSGLLAMRWMLGMFEAGLFPGVTYYLSCWYKRTEFGIRLAIFFSAATVSGAFGGFLAAAISNMGGAGGKPAWAWIFIIEGIITIIAGILSFYIIQDFPENARLLSEPERVFIIRRLQVDNQFSAAGEKLRWKYILQSLLDWKTWVAAALGMGVGGPLNAISLFLPTIINQLGFTATPANLMTVPVYTLACVFTCLVGFLGDRYGKRGCFTLGFYGMAAIGYIILITSRNAGLSYFAVYLAACGVFPVIANNVAWVANNIEGSYKRSVTIALNVSFGNINGAVISNLYRARDRPRYLLGHAIVLAYIAFGLSAALIFYIGLRRENARRDRGERDEVIVGVNDEKANEEQVRRNGRFQTVEEAKREKGDKWSGFRYVL